MGKTCAKLEKTKKELRTQLLEKSFRQKRPRALSHLVIRSIVIQLFAFDAGEMSGQLTAIRSFAFAVGEVPDQGAEEVDEAFQDADDHEAHQDPLPYLGGEGAFDDTAEAKADDRDDQGRHHRHPNGDAFHKLYFIHCKIDLICQLLFSLVIMTPGYSVLLSQQ